MQQLARVDTVTVKEGRPVAEITTTGDLISANYREYFRVTTLSAELTTDFGSEKNCEVRDISIRGFAVVVRSIHTIGDIVYTALHFAGKSVCGRARIQSVRELSQQWIRYGVVGVDENLLSALPGISMAVQLQQLRRISGTD